ncbi:MAG TPA: hypothetical protein VGM43_21540 [Bryobacteraceae bacterium]|jgi:uncharacterized protein (TIGR03437 family)
MRHSIVFRKLPIVFCLLGASLGYAQTPVVESVLHAANYSPLIAPGVWVAIFGSNLSPTTTVDTTLPIPLQLGGVTVTMSGSSSQRAPLTEQLPLRYVSSIQINALIPFDLAPGGVNLVVATPTGTSEAFSARLSNLAPAIYSQNATGTGPALVFDANFQPVTQVTTAPLVLYASGLGATNPPGTSAGGSAAEPFNRTVSTPLVRIGGVQAQVLFSGLAPGLPGVYQLNVVPSSSTPPEDNSLSVGFFNPLAGSPGPGGLTTLPVPEGSNTANVTGSLSPTYPVNSTVLTFTPLVTAAKFSAEFDILPGAQPFNLVASCPGGSMTVAFNPAAGTWQATANVPTQTLRSGDFSNVKTSQGSFIQILDFLNDNFQFPNNVIPPSRLDPVAVQAMSSVPLPNYTGPIANVNLLLRGAIPPGGHFVVSDSSNSNLANFGGFVYVNKPNFGNQFWRTNVCSLVMDGVLMSSSLITFQ